MEAESRKKNMTRKVIPANSPKFLSAYSTNEISSTNRREYVTIQINGHEVKLQLDAPLDITLSSRKTRRDSSKLTQIPSEVVAGNASGGILNFQGEMKCHVCYGDLWIRTKYVVTNQPELSQIGLDCLDELKWLK